MGKTMHFGLFFLCPFIAFPQNEIRDSIINSNDIRASIEYLASDSLKGRLTGSPEAKMAADYIALAFQNAGAKPVAGNDGYFYKFDFWLNPNIVGYNVVAAFPGSSKKEESIIFSAHYDHVGTASAGSLFSMRPPPERRDTIYNGANDNASGVALLIALAKFYGAVKNNERTIVLVAFSGEELGLVGSNAMAKSINQPNLVTCMINFDMVGKGSRPFITGAEYGNLRDLLNSTLRNFNQKVYRKNYFGLDRYDESNLFKRSDNIPFARLHIPAHTIMTIADDDPYYHSVNDEISRLDIDLIRDVCKAVTVAMAPIVKGDLSPQRIYPLFTK